MLIQLPMRLITSLCLVAAQEAFTGQEACISNTDSNILMHTRAEVLLAANRSTGSTVNVSSAAAFRGFQGATSLNFQVDAVSSVIAERSKSFLMGCTMAVTFYLLLICLVEPAKAHDKAERSLRHSVLPILSWVGFSMVLSIFNKWIMVPAGANFAFPVSLCSMHMLATTSVLWIMRFAKPCLFPGLGAFSLEAIPVLVLPVLGVGLMGAISLVLSNFSIKYLSVALINMLKTANPPIALLLAVLLGTKDSRSPMKKISFAMLLMIVGASITCYGDLLFSAMGLACFLGGSFLQQFRLILLKQVLGNALQWDPLSTLAVVSPVALIFLTVATAVVEVPHLPYSRLLSDQRLQQVLVLNSMIAVALNVSSVRLLDIISPVSFTVVSVVRDLVTTRVSLLIFGGIITPLQILGYAVAIVGFLYYDHLKKIQSEALAEANNFKATLGVVGAQANAN